MPMERACVWRACGVCVSVMAVAGLAVHSAPAQSDGPRPSAAATAPESPRFAHAYRGSVPIAERIEFEVQGAGKPERAQAVLRIVPGDAAVPPSVRLELGHLVIFASGDTLRAVHAKNPTTYADVALPGGLSAAALAAALPPLVLPQVGLALPSPAHHAHALDDAMTVLDLTFQPSPADGPRLALATLPTGQARLEFDSTTARLRAYEFVPRDGSFTLRATVTPLTPEEAAALPPAVWAIDVAQRQRLVLPTAQGTPAGAVSPDASALALLVPLEPDVRVGDVLPAMGLMSAAWDAQPLPPRLEALAELPPQPPGVVAAVLVMACVQENGLFDAPGVLAAATRAARRVTKEFELDRLRGVLETPRLLPLMVGVLEVRDVGPQLVPRIAPWLAAQKVDALPVEWTTIGAETFRRVAPGARAAIVVVDRDLRVLGVVPLDGRGPDERTLASELRAIIAGQ